MPKMQKSQLYSLQAKKESSMKIALALMIILSIAILLTGCKDAETQLIEASGYSIESDPSFDAITTSIAYDFNNMEALEIALSEWDDTETAVATLHCGCHVRYETAEDFPRESVQCPHDNYFVRIGERL